MPSVRTAFQRTAFQRTAFQRTAVQRTAVLAVGLATAAGLAVAGSSSARADPPSLNVDPCAQLLARAAIWPGGAPTVPATSPMPT